MIPEPFLAHKAFTVSANQIVDRIHLEENVIVFRNHFQVPHDWAGPDADQEEDLHGHGQILKERMDSGHDSGNRQGKTECGEHIVRKLDHIQLDRQTGDQIDQDDQQDEKHVNDKSRDNLDIRKDGNVEPDVFDQIGVFGQG